MAQDASSSSCSFLALALKSAFFWGFLVSLSGEWYVEATLSSRCAHCSKVLLLSSPLSGQSIYVTNCQVACHTEALLTLLNIWHLLLYGKSNNSNRVRGCFCWIPSLLYLQLLATRAGMPFSMHFLLTLRGVLYTTLEYSFTCTLFTAHMGSDIPCWATPLFTLIWLLDPMPQLHLCKSPDTTC